MASAKQFPRPGEPAPWFTALSTSRVPYKLDSHAGRYLVVTLLQSSSLSASKRLLDVIQAEAARFDYERLAFVGVSIDPLDLNEQRLVDRGTGIRFVFDTDRSASKACGTAVFDDDSAEAQAFYRRLTLVLDERLRVIAALPLDEGNVSEHLGQLFAILDSLPPLSAPSLAQVQAPILVVPQVFEPELCRALIGYYETHGGEESGFMREVNGMTVEAYNPEHKRRRDQEIVDEALRQRAMFAVHDKVGPEIRKAFQFDPTRIERHIVACYDGTEGGHFRAHRDNTTKGTAHRRFAVSLNLNTGEYDGGRLRFPEFGRLEYEAPAGGAVIFSCSLLHEATRVTRGKRYAYLPFLYDDAAARIREANLKYVNQPPGAS